MQHDSSLRWKFHSSQFLPGVTSTLFPGHQRPTRLGSNFVSSPSESSSGSKYEVEVINGVNGKSNYLFLSPSKISPKKSFTIKKAFCRAPSVFCLSIQDALIENQKWPPLN